MFGPEYNMKIPKAKIINPRNTALLPPNLSAKKPKMGANIPQNSICIPIAKPNSVLVTPRPFSKASKKRPKVCLRPIEIKITQQADAKTIKARLLGKKFFTTLCTLKNFLNHQLNPQGLQVQYVILQYVHLYQI